MAEEKRPRIFQGGRDMSISMAIIVALMIIIVLPTGLCTFNPGAPESGPVQEVDAESFMSLEARSAEFPVVLPDTPEGWTPNSARRTQIDGQPAPVVGYVTAETGYLQLTQTDVPLADAVRGVDADPREHTGTEVIAGHDVEIYTSEESDVRDLWVADAGSTRYLISGVASDEEFATLMEAALVATPIDTADDSV